MGAGVVGLVVAWILTILGSGAWQSAVGVLSGAVMLVEGLVLASDWRGGRGLVVARLQERSLVRRRRLRRPVRALLGLALFVVGLAFVGSGVLAILTAF